MAAWTPAAIETTIWLDGADASTIDIETGASVWRSKSGDGNQVQQTQATRQPLYDPTNQWLDFDGSDNQMRFVTQPFTGTTPRLVIAVYQQDVAGSSGNGYFSATDVTGVSGYLWDLCPEGSNFYVRVFGNDYFQPSSSLNELQMASADWISGSSSTTQLYLNGAESPRAGGSSTTINTALGNAWLGTTSDQSGTHYNGKIAEMVILTGDEISDGNRILLEGYLAHKWGLALPVDHPYAANPPELTTDEYIDDVKSLLHFDTDATDETGLSWQELGSLTFANGVMDTASAGYLLSDASIDLEIGTGDFTFEFTLENASASGTHNYFDSRTATLSGLAVYGLNTGTTLNVGNNVGVIISGTTPVRGQAGKFKIALVRQSGVLYFFVNGNLEGSTSFLLDWNEAAATVSLGSNYIGTQAAPALYDEFRYTKGVARYTANYTPAPEPFPDATDVYFDSVASLCHDNGTNGDTTTTDEIAGVTWAGGVLSDTWAEYGTTSLYVNGTTGYISTSDIADFGAGDWVVEFTAKAAAGGTNIAPFSFYTPSNVSGGLLIQALASGVLSVSVADGSTPITGTTNVRDDQPHKIALAKVGGYLRLFVDGVQDHATAYADSHTYTVGTSGIIFGYNSYLGSEVWNGYLDERRITIGNGRYSSDYTPATGPFPDAVGPVPTDEFFDDVVALIHFDEGVGGNPVEVISGATLATVGGFALSGAEVKYGPTSGYFAPGASSVLLPVQQLIDAGWGVGDFTIELYYYLASGGAAASDRLFMTRDGDIIPGLYLSHVGGTTIQMGVSTTGGQPWPLTSGYALLTGAWNHIAMVRSGANIGLYINGDLQETIVESGDLYLVPGENAVIGGQSNGRACRGYIDEVRLDTTARYTANFTPPTAPFPDAGPVVELPTDEYFDSVLALLHFDGANGSTVIVDSSPNPLTLAVTGGAEITGGALDVTGPGDYVAIPAGTIDWNAPLTVEVKVVRDVTGEKVFLSDNSAATGVVMEVNPSGVVRFFAYPSLAVNLIGTTVLTVGQSYDVALTRDAAGFWRLFVDGVIEASMTGATISASPIDLRLGSYPPSSAYDFNGTLDEVRLTQACRYTADYTPAIAPFPDQGPPVVEAPTDEYFDSVVAYGPFSDSYIDSKTLDVWEQLGSQYTNIDTPGNGVWGGAGLTSTQFGGWGGVRHPEQDILAGVSTEDLTLDLWYAPTTLPTGSTFHFLINYTGVFTVFLYQGDLYWRQGATELVTPVAWAGALTEYSFMRLRRYFDGVWNNEVWLDGTLVSSGTGGVMPEVATAQIILLNEGGNHNANGKASQFRATLGTARAGADVPTGPFPDAVGPVPTDELFDEVVVLCHYDEAGDILDEKGNTWIFYGNPTPPAISLADSKWGAGSLWFGGTDGYTETGDTTTYKWLHDGTTDYTAEGWVKSTLANTWQTILTTGGQSLSQTGFAISLSAAGGWDALISNGSGTPVARIQAGSYTVDQWHHWAVTVEGATMRLFVDGVLLGSATLAAPSAGNHWYNLLQGRYIGGVTSILSGQQDDLRLTKGTARYTADFTPPTAPFPDAGPVVELPTDEYFDSVVSLLPFDTDATDEIPGVNWTTYNDAAFSGGRADFPTSNQSRIATNNIASFGTGDYTIEGVINGAPHVSLGFVLDSRGTNAPWLYVNANQGTMNFVLQGGGAINWNGSTNVLDGADHTFAVSRINGYTRFLIDGQIEAEGADANDYQMGEWRWGNGDNGSYPLAATLDNLRVTAGVGRYSGAYTPIDGPFPTAGPVLPTDEYFDSVISLLHMDGDAQTSTLIDVVPTTTWSWLQAGAPLDGTDPKFGTANMTFPSGAGAYATSTDMPDLGTGDFTVECWFRSSVTPANYNFILDAATSGLGRLSMHFLPSENHVTMANGSVVTAVGSINVRDGAWHKISYTRIAGVGTLRIDGVTDGTYADTTNYLWGGWAKWGNGDPSNGFSIQGDLDECRITRSGRYTADYTPATAPFPDQGPTLTDEYFADVFALCHFEGSDGSTTIDDVVSDDDWTCYGNAQLDTGDALTGASSLLLDGTGDYIDRGVAADWKFLHDGTTDYTIEFTMRLADSGTHLLLDTSQGTTANAGIWLRAEANGAFYFALHVGVSSNRVFEAESASGLWTTGALHRVAVVVRPATGAELYLDGVSVATWTNSGTAHGAGDPPFPLRIGYWASLSGHDLNGSIDELRITKAERYTANYTPSPAPFPDTGSVIEPEPEIEPLVVAVSPEFVTEMPGVVTTITCTATGETPLTYQWYVDDVAIPGETGTTYDITATNDGEIYHVTVTDSLGSLDSIDIPLTVLVPEELAVSVAPLSSNVVSGTSVTLTATASGQGTITYQWYRDDVVIGGATSAALTYTATVDGEIYHVVVTDDYATLPSADVLSTVTPQIPELVIDTQPASVTVNLGENATFTVAATGNDPLDYQWKLDGVDLPGQNAATLVVATDPTKDGGVYTVVVGDNEAQTVTSTGATLTVVVAAPTVGTVVSKTAAIGEEIAFTFSYSGTGVLAFQWFEDGVAIPSGTAPLLGMLVTADTFGRQYQCVVSDSYGGESTTNAAEVTEYIPPVDVPNPGLDDQTEKRTPSRGYSGAEITHNKADFAGMVRAAAGPGPHYYDEYRFSGKTFRKRHQLINERKDDE